MLQQSHGLFTIAKLLVPNPEDRDVPKKTSRDRLEIETFKTETTVPRVQLKEAHRAHPVHVEDFYLDTGRAVFVATCNGCSMQLASCILHPLHV